MRLLFVLLLKNFFKIGIFGSAAKKYIIIGICALIAIFPPRNLDGEKSESINIFFSKDVPSNVKFQILRDIQRLRTIRGKVGFAIHEKIFGKLEKESDALGELYFQFFIKRVHHIGWRPISHSLLSAGAEKSPGWIFATEVYQQGINTNDSNLKYVNYIDRMNALLHEAKHNEATGTSSKLYHIECGKELMKLREVKYSRSCDSDAEGAYAAGVVFLRNLELYCANCKNIEKQVAGRIARDLLFRIVNHKALEKELWPN